MIAVDGTKVHANASRNENVDYEQLAREILEEAKAVDAAEDELYGEARGDELPDQLRTGEGRRAWLREAKRQLEAERAKEAAAGAAQPPEASQGSQAAAGGRAVDRGPRQRGLRGLPARGRMKDGRRVRQATDALHAAGDTGGRINVTDPDSHVVKGAARVHSGLQRPSRHQRAPDRDRRRGDDRRAGLRATRADARRRAARAAQPPASPSAPECCSPTPATGISSRWSASSIAASRC